MTAVPDAVAPPPRHPRFPLFDGLRAVAVLAVLAVHVVAAAPVADGALTRPLYHLNFGVTIFFVISGFLLYRPFVAHRAGGPSAPSFAEYGRRRVLRIVPAYWLCLAVLLVIPGAIALGTPELLAQFGLVHTMPFAGQATCTAQLGGCWLAHAWSLGVEATFYALLPLWVLAADRMARGRTTSVWVRNEILALITVSVVAGLLRFGVFEGDVTSITGGTAIGFAFWFALGMGLAVLSAAASAADSKHAAVAWIGRHASLLWVAAVATYLAVSEWLPASLLVVDRADQVVAFVAFGLAALLLVLPAVFGDPERGAPARILGAPAVAWLGLVSYGIFLWHVAVISLLDDWLEPISFVPLAALSLLVTTAIAAASYYLLERPLLRLKYRRMPVRGAASSRG